MKERYYTPEIGEIHVGYVCEKYEILIGEFDKILPSPQWYKHVILNIDCINFLKLINEKKLRTLYLSKKQIEDEGWKFEQGDNAEMTFLKERYRVIYNFDTYQLWIDDAITNGQILGGMFCNSINEFRLIFKLLGYK
jgi:hypothetical protein